MMKSVKMVLAAGMLIGLCVSSQATILLPGQSGLDSNLTLGPPPIARQFSSVSGGILVWSMVTMNPANPLGGLSFYYQVIGTGTGSASTLSIPNFGIVPGAPVDVGYSRDDYDNFLPGFPIHGQIPFGPGGASRSDGNGDVITFFTGGISDMFHTYIMVINTPFQDFSVVTGSVNGSIPVPVLAPVPEPSTIVAGALLLLPFGASALRMRRKKGPVPES